MRPGSVEVAIFTAVKIGYFDLAAVLGKSYCSSCRCGCMLLQCFAIFRDQEF